MTTSLRRWICPKCGGGALAPSKPRRDDVRRYCLPCSTKTGRLVERTCPALDKAREARAETAKAKATRARRAKAARSAAYYVAGGVDVRAFARRAWLALGRKSEVPPYTVGRSPHRGSGACGRAWPMEQRWRILVGPEVDRARVEVIVVHELAHLVAPPNAMHDARFNRVFCAACEKLWGFGIVGGRGYGPSRVIEHKLRERYEGKAIADATPTPPADEGAMLGAEEDTVETAD